MLLASGSVPGVGGTWDATHKNPSITLSGGDLIATKTGGTPNSRAVYGNTAFSSTLIEKAKVTFSGTGDTDDAVGVGLSNADVANGTRPGTVDNRSVGYIPSGAVTINGSTVATLASWTAGSSSITCEVDDANRQIRFSVNGGTFSAWVSYSTMPAGSVYIGAAVEQTGDAMTLDPN